MSTTRETAEQKTAAPARPHPLGGLMQALSEATERLTAALTERDIADVQRWVESGTQRWRDLSQRARVLGVGPGNKLTPVEDVEVAACVEAWNATYYAAVSALSPMGLLGAR